MLLCFCDEIHVGSKAAFFVCRLKYLKHAAVITFCSHRRWQENKRYKRQMICIRDMTRFQFFCSEMSLKKQNTLTASQTVKENKLIQLVKYSPRDLNKVSPFILISLCCSFWWRALASSPYDTLAAYAQPSLMCVNIYLYVLLIEVLLFNLICNMQCCMVFIVDQLQITQKMDALGWKGFEEKVKGKQNIAQHNIYSILFS